MDILNTLLENPFRFAAGVVGTIVLSILSAFIKDWIIKLFGNFSNHWKNKKELQKLKLEAQADALLSNTNLLILYGFTTLLGNIFSVSIITLAVTFPFAMSSALSVRPEYAKYARATLFEMDFHDPLYLVSLVIGLMGILLPIFFLLLISKVSQRNRVLLHTLKKQKKNCATSIELP
jgi:hypothetical protein